MANQVPTHDTDLKSVYVNVSALLSEIEKLAPALSDTQISIQAATKQWCTDVTGETETLNTTLSGLLTAAEDLKSSLNSLTAIEAELRGYVARVSAEMARGLKLAVDDAEISTSEQFRTALETATVGSVAKIDAAFRPFSTAFIDGEHALRSAVTAVEGELVESVRRAVEQVVGEVKKPLEASLERLEELKRNPLELNSSIESVVNAPLSSLSNEVGELREAVNRIQSRDELLVQINSVLTALPTQADVASCVRSEADKTVSQIEVLNLRIDALTTAVGRIGAMLGGENEVASTMMIVRTPRLWRRLMAWLGRTRLDDDRPM